MKRHIWRQYLHHGGRGPSCAGFLAYCGAHITLAPGEEVTTEDEPEKFPAVSCTHCLKSLRDETMRRVRRQALVVERATERLESLRRLRNRRKKPCPSST